MAHSDDRVTVEPGAAMEPGAAIEHHQRAGEFVALLDGTLVGRLGYTIDSEGWNVYTTVVDRDFQRRGIATQLIAAAAAAADSSGAPLRGSCWFAADWIERRGAG